MDASTFHINTRTPRQSEIYGKKLTPGDVILKEHVMDGSDGTWHRVPHELVGQKLQENAGATIVCMVMTT